MCSNGSGRRCLRCWVPHICFGLSSLQPRNHSCSLKWFFFFSHVFFLRLPSMSLKAGHETSLFATSDSALWLFIKRGQILRGSLLVSVLKWHKKWEECIWKKPNNKNFSAHDGMLVFPRFCFIAAHIKRVGSWNYCIPPLRYGMCIDYDLFTRILYGT